MFTGDSECFRDGKCLVVNAVLEDDGASSGCCVNGVLDVYCGVDDEGFSVEGVCLEGW